MNGFAILFYTFGILAVLAAIGVILFKHPVYSAMCLVANLFLLAALYILLHAEFLAAIQILTYAGAIMVLFIFIIMLLNLKPDELEEKGMSPFAKFLLALIGCAMFAGFVYLLLPMETRPRGIAEGFGSVQSLGKELFTTYIVPFELAGILLTIALVGAVLLAKRNLSRFER